MFRSPPPAACFLVTCLVCLPFAQTAAAQETEAGTRQFAAAVGFQNQKLYEQAIEEWQTFVKKFPTDPRMDKALHYLGTCQLQSGKNADAVASFRTVLDRYPKFEALDQTLLNL